MFVQTVVVRKTLATVAVVVDLPVDRIMAVYEELRPSKRLNVAVVCIRLTMLISREL